MIGSRYYSFTLSETFNKLSLIYCPIFPSIFAFSMGLALHVSPFVVIPIREYFFSKSMF